MKRILLVGLTLVVLLIGTASFVLIRAIKANTPSLSSIPQPIPTPNPNGFDYFVQAARLQGRDDARADALIHKGFTLPCVCPSTRGTTQSLTPEFTELRALARHMRERAQAIQKANPASPTAWKNSTTLGLDVIEIGARLPRGGSTLPSLVGAAMLSLGNNPIEAAPTHVDAPTARDSAHRLEKIIALRPTVADILREDKYQLQSSLIAMGNQAKAQKGVNSGFHPLPDAIQATMYHQLTSGYDHFIADSAKPYAQRDKDYSPPVGPAASLINVLSRFRFNEGRALVTLQLLEVRFALRSFKLRQGSYPQSLQELVPRELTKVPLDAYGAGAELCYERKGNGYQLWSFGPDGKNDNARSLKYKQGKSSRFYAPESLGDIVFSEKA